jgi:hypothetical protein
MVGSRRRQVRVQKVMYLIASVLVAAAPPALDHCVSDDGDDDDDVFFFGSRVCQQGSESASGTCVDVVEFDRGLGVGGHDDRLRRRRGAEETWSGYEIVDGLDGRGS